MKQRSGFTLAEVLIALLVMALGLLALLALFPVGIYSMAQAVKDDRSGTLANNAEGMARIFWRNAWLDSYGNVSPESSVLPANSWIAALDTQVYTPAYDPTTDTRPGACVYADPIGVATGNSNWVGKITNVLPRRSIPPVDAGGAGSRLRLLSVLDDMTFDTNGNPNTNNNTTLINRGARYNYALLLQRLNQSARTQVNVTVVVYQQRPYADRPVNETSVGQISLTPPTTATAVSTVQIPTGSLPRINSWYLATNTPTVSANVSQPFADFYRVVGVDSASNTMELSPPIRPRGASTTAAYSAYLIAMDNVVEVFDRGTLSAFNPPAN